MPIKLFFPILLGLLVGGIAAIIPNLTNQERPRLPTDFSVVLSTNTTKREVVGFLPYWNLDSYSYLPYDQLTSLYYFAIDVDGEGNINKSDGGWQKLKSENYQSLRDRLNQNKQIRPGVTFVSLDADSIARVVNNKTRQDRLIKNIISVMNEEKFIDLNFDFEYFGDLDQNTINNYTALVSRITSSVHQNFPGSIVSIDVYADSVAKRRIFDIPAIGKIVDRIIIMGYDFHRMGSEKAGPIAPLFGKDKYEYEIYQSILDFLKNVPNEKIVLAVPFYGYEWPTEGAEPNSFVIKSPKGPQISSYKRALSVAKDNNVAVNFDDESKSAWFSYFDKESRTFRQVWFENERSLGLKFDLVNQANLAGIGIWALGYDGPDAKLLWQTIEDKLGKSN